MIPVLLPALERHGRLEPSYKLRSKLLAASQATIDRLLTEVRIVAQGGQRRRAGMSSAVRRSVPVSTFGDWNDPPPGIVEVGFAAHSGTSSAGNVTLDELPTAAGGDRRQPEHAMDAYLTGADRVIPRRGPRCMIERVRHSCRP